MIGLGSISQLRLRDGFLSGVGYCNKYETGYGSICNMVNGYGYGIFIRHGSSGLLYNIDYYDLDNSLLGLSIDKDGIDNNINYYL